MSPYAAIINAKNVIAPRGMKSPSLGFDSSLFTSAPPTESSICCRLFKALQDSPAAAHRHPPFSTRPEAASNWKTVRSPTHCAWMTVCPNRTPLRAPAPELRKNSRQARSGSSADGNRTTHQLRPRIGVALALRAVSSGQRSCHAHRNPRAVPGIASVDLG